ncbi:PHD finger domain-containing protein [Histoplasma capsulatum G186AR]|uniref:Chromatin modification-related protein n=1 Tax=Ajellomyces capsulatus (strain G186AR / H82 / ATCC MYA-2454 / RMSCC 2432) TaxID=447093 RepID=C0NJQ3_AJECG|nr:PHD finger domain-containing protein [Histoplasma capsulatum G186AR]EEH08094.1 PHD finger domain-containing protein [Histoplasma capsulatum G186AR]
MATALAPGAAHAANSTTSTGLGPSTTSHSNSIRQPARQTRTNPSRTSKTASRTTFASLGLHGSSGVYGLGSSVGLGGAGAGAGGAGGGARRESAARNIPHGLYPAITHFTDAITALPKEFRRHASLLKEVDGKAWALEEALSKQLDAATASTPYAKLMQGGIPTKEPINYDSPEALARRKIFFDLRSTLSDLMITTDEKNHVLWNANNELEKQIRRIDATFPYVEGEISEEARLGSLTHWAYSNKTVAKTTGNTSERPRRETAATRDHNLAAALEGEARREGVSRKHRRTYGDVDAEDGRIPTRKGTGGKGKSSETLSNIPIGAGVAAASSAAPAKRRRVEKPQPIASATGSAMERSASTTTNAGTGRGAVKDVSATDGVKKRVRAPNANPTGRKRTNTTASATGSPALLPSSAILPLNALTKAASPAPNIIPVTPSSRSQLASTQVTNGRQRPSSSASNRAPNSSTLPGPTPACITRLDVPNPVVPIAEKPTSSDLKPSTLSRDTAITRIEPTSSTLAEVNKDEKASPSISTTPRPAELVPKQEDTAPASYNNINNSNANNATKAEAGSSSEPQPKGRSSKNSTPVLSALPDLSQQHSQPQRTTRPRGGTVTAADGGGPGGPSTSSGTGAGSGAGTTKRSHKKGAGLAPAAQQLVAAAATEDEDSSRQGDDEEEEGEPRYCYCNQVSFGEMVACDNETCPREWFHLSCVGLSRAPLKSSKWYCNECKDNLKKGKLGNGK